MGKRKRQAISHTQEHCDVWLSTAGHVASSKRQRVLALRPTNIASIVLSSQPLKAGTKQTSIQQFFCAKTGKENRAGSCAPSDSCHKALPPSRIEAKSRAHIPVCPETLTQALPSSVCSGVARDQGVRDGLQSEVKPWCQEHHRVSERSDTYVDEYRDDRTSSLEFQEDTKAKDQSGFKRVAGLNGPSRADEYDTSINLKSNAVSPSQPSTCSDTEPEDFTFTTSSQGSLALKNSFLHEHPMMMNQLADDRDSNLGKCNITHVNNGCRDVHVDDQSLSTNDSASCRILSDSEDFDFTMTTQGWLKLRDPHCRSAGNRLSEICEGADHKVPTSSSNDRRTLLPELTHCHNPREISAVSLFQSEDDSEEVVFTMGTEGCWKVKSHVH